MFALSCRTCLTNAIFKISMNQDLRVFTYNRKEQWQPYLLKPRSVPSWLSQLKSKWQGLLRVSESLYGCVSTFGFACSVFSENYTVIGYGVIFLFRFQFERNVLLPDLDLSIHHWVVWLCRLWNRSYDHLWLTRIGKEKEWNLFKRKAINCAIKDWTDLKWWWKHYWTKCLCFLDFDPGYHYRPHFPVYSEISR